MAGSDFSRKREMRVAREREVVGIRFLREGRSANNKTCAVVVGKKVSYFYLKGNIMEMIKNFIQEEDGATAVEYGLLVALIAAVIVGTVATLGNQIKNAFQTVVDALP
jgi:pilus assembly protein Flp/PilA